MSTRQLLFIPHYQCSRIIYGLEIVMLSLTVIIIMGNCRQSKSGSRSSHKHTNHRQGAGKDVGRNLSLTALSLLASQKPNEVSSNFFKYLDVEHSSNYQTDV